MRESFRRVIRIQNPSGLHIRAADRFARAAKRYSCTVSVINGDAKADGKDILGLITLMVFPDSDVVLEVEGVDARTAIDALSEVLGAPSGEDYSI
jgi:phosphotransferase system HPr (HPr) family protein